ncbi:MAG: hypothetical protein Q9219_000874 [cf. Caloplaca sp. 3 TL-2023]
MDVTRQTFHNLLPALIAAVADAHFVAIDLELSGIPGQQINKSRPRENLGPGKPSLQQRYEETKKAAETYQVLQLGITCVWENRNRGNICRQGVWICLTLSGVYVVRPYNFFLNPVPDERLNVERVFSYQSGAVDFLLKHDFRMEAPFLEGVSYFSREEEAKARQLTKQRQDTANITDIVPQADDTESLELLERLQEEVMAWKNRTTPMPDFLNFAAVGFDQLLHPEKGLNSYHKRLVHQYIRTAHPDLVTISRQGFIQIVAYDNDRETADQKYRARMFDERLTRQIGLRWLIEAICGGDLSPINPNSFYTTVKARQERAAAEFIKVRDQLEGKSTVLVGHNFFLDLIYFHACFFGPLPDRVEDFQRTIHGLFPRIIDTKYLATHKNDESALARSSLEELHAKLSKQTEPIIELHPQHANYAIKSPSHEAGYDSYLTARVLIRLSTVLELSGIYLDERDDAVRDDENYFTPPEDRTPEEGSGGIPIDINTIPAHLSTSEESSSSSQYIPSHVPVSTRSAFSHATTFDLLGDIPSDEDSVTFTISPQKKERQASKKVEKRKKKMDAESGRRMPAWESTFWELYGNKLRVNGTVEGVCDLGDWPS